jgi:hypothetical protein
MRLLIIFCAFLLQSLHYESEAALTTVPQSTAVITGTTAQLNCAADNDTAGLSFQWIYTGLQSVPVRIVYNCQVNPDYADKYQVIQTDDGECNLVILNTALSSAGTYSCQNGFEQVSAVIVMLSSDSACSAIPSGNLISGDIIRIRCVLNYNGSVSPRMLWFDNSTGFPITNETTSTFPTQVNSFIDVPVFPPTSRPFNCRTFFDPPLTYTYNWFLPTLYVQYFVTDVLATARVTYFEEPSLVCSAQGYPAPTFQWTNIDSGDTFDGATVPISETGVSRYACEASNTIRGQTQTIRTAIAADITQAFPENCPTTPEPTTTTVITTEVETEPTTTTTEPSTTTTTTTEEPIGECGRLLSQASSGDVTLPSGWSLMCYISRNDTALLSTQCRNLIIDLPPGFPTYNELLQSGGNFGCATTQRDDFLQATLACFDGYQQTSILASCPSCPRMFVCIRVP